MLPAGPLSEEGEEERITLMKSRVISSKLSSPFSVPVYYFRKNVRMYRQYRCHGGDPSKLFHFSHISPPNPSVKSQLLHPGQSAAV